MKSNQLIKLAFVLLSFVSSLAFANPISDEEKNGLQLMREEEKLARDVYTFLYQQWEIPVFSNISNSETRHFNAIVNLLKNFKIPDPAPFEAGKFKNQEIAFLYDSLTQKGSESLIEALKVSAFIEEFDIADLQKLLASNTDSTIEGVYKNLLRGSKNHLRAFTRQLANRNEIYMPLILDEITFLEIVQGNHQTGRNKNCEFRQNNCSNLQHTTPKQNRNRGKKRMRGKNAWN